jgi:hypothetical protein
MLRRNANSHKQADLKVKKEKWHKTCEIFLKSIWAKLFDSCFKKFRNFYFTTQALLFFTPLMFILMISLIITHSSEFHNNILVEYLNLYESMLIRPVVENIKTFEVELENLKLIDKVDSNYKMLLFNKIYFKELTEKNLMQELVFDYLDENSNLEKLGRLNENLLSNTQISNLNNELINIISAGDMKSIFPPTEKIYQELNSYSTPYLQNFLQIFYLTSPLLIQNENFNENLLLKFYLMFYPLEDKHNFNNSNIYFQYPIEDQYVSYENINFKPYDIFSDPYLYYMKGKSNTSEVNSNEIKNWFSDLDHSFINKIPKSKIFEGKDGFFEKCQNDMIFLIDISSALNMESYNLPYTQFLVEYNNKTIIFAIVSKYVRQTSFKEGYQYFSFLNLINNYQRSVAEYTKTEESALTLKSPIQDKYIYNSHLISLTKIFPFIVPDTFEKYSRQGMVSSNDKLNYLHTNMDVVEFKNFNKMDKVYHISQYFQADLLIYNVIYIYNSFFLKLQEMYYQGITSLKNEVSKNNYTDFMNSSNLNFSSSFIYRNQENFASIGDTTISDEIFLKIGKTEKNIIEEICSNFNLTYYYEMINTYADINCFNSKEISIYTQFYNSEKNSKFFDFGLDKPNCFCVPFYCLEMNNTQAIQDFKTKYENKLENFQFSNEITLPSKCELILSGYSNLSKLNSFIYSDIKYYDFKFIADTQGLKINPEKSIFNVFMMDSYSDGELMLIFEYDLHNYIDYITLIYILLMIIFVIVSLYFFFMKAGSIYKSIKDFEVENKFAFIKSENQILNGINSNLKNSFVTKEELAKKKRMNIFGLRDVVIFRNSLRNYDSQNNLKIKTPDLVKINDRDKKKSNLYTNDQNLDKLKNSINYTNMNLDKLLSGKNFQKLNQKNTRRLLKDEDHLSSDLGVIYYENDHSANSLAKNNKCNSIDVINNNQHIINDKLTTIKEFNEGYSEDLIEFEEKNLTLQDKKFQNFFKNQNYEQHISLSINNTQKNNHAENYNSNSQFIERIEPVHIKNEKSFTSSHSEGSQDNQPFNLQDISELDLDNSRLIMNTEEENSKYFNNYNEDNLTLKEIPEDLKKDINKRKKLKLKNNKKNNYSKKQSINLENYLKKSSKNISNLKTPNLDPYASEWNELIDIFDLVKSNVEIFKIDFNLDKNINEKHYIIEKYKYFNENLKKFNQLFDDFYENEEEIDFSQSNELSKLILNEVVSTEFCNYKGMSFNFRYKFSENICEDITMIKNILHGLKENDVKNKSRSSYIFNHISNIKKYLKLVEKETILDVISKEIENRILKEEHGQVKSDGNSYSDYKSIIFYYLEKILLQWMKQIYYDQLTQQMGNS